MNISPVPEYTPEKNLSENANCSIETLCNCDYFRAEKLNLKNKFLIPADIKSFKILLCTEGNGIISEKNNIINFKKGDCVFISACSDIAELSGKAELLIIMH